MTKHPPPSMVLSSSVSVAFCWIYNNNFRDGSSVLTRSCLHLHIPFTTVFTWVDLYNTTNTPISSNCVSISDVDYIVYSYVSFLCIPFLPWYQHGKESLVHIFQNESTIFCTNSTRCLGSLVSLNGPCKIRLDALPNNMSLGHKYDPSSGSLGVLQIGRSLTRFASSISTLLTCNF